MMKGVSKYKEIVAILRKEMSEGRYASSSAFPSVMALMRRFGVARATIVRAVAELRHLGLVQSRPGSGTVVTRKGRASSGRLGLIVQSYAEMFPPICRRLLSLAQEKGYLLMVGDTSAGDPAARPSNARRLAENFIRSGIAGVMYQPLAFHQDADRTNLEILRAFRAANVPVVLFDSAPTTASDDCELDMVGIDNFTAGKRMAAHLVQSGAETIVFAVGKYPTEGNLKRLEGVRIYAGDHGVVCKAHFGEASAVARKFARGVFGVGRTAILASCDHYAVDILRSLVALGRKVPEDLLLAGYDDVNDARMCTPSLTTVRMPCEEIALEAFRCLQERIADSGLLPRRILLPVHLVIRESTGKGNLQK